MAVTSMHAEIAGCLGDFEDIARAPDRDVVVQLRDKNLLQHLWNTDNAPWKLWP